MLAIKTIVSEQQRHQELNGPEELEQTKVKFNMNSDSKVSPKDNVPALPVMWDSLESDTESLVQEKEYQRDLQMRIDLLSAENHKHDVKTDSEEPNHLDVQDSLDLKPRRVKGPHVPLRQDEYADLRYDPNWRNNLEGAYFLNRLNARLSLDSFEESEDSLEPLENVPLGSRQEYVVFSNPATVQMNNALSPPPSSPFHLHPQQEDILDSPESKTSCLSSEGTPRDNGEHLNVKSVHTQKRRSQHPSNPRPPRQTSYETISTHSPESQDNVWDPELMWLQKTQKLKQSHKEKKEPKRKERTSNHPDQLKPPVPDSKPKVHLKPLTERHVISADHLPHDSEEAYTHDPPQHQSGLPVPMLQLPTSPQLEASHSPPKLLPNDEESMGPCAPPTQISGPYTVLPPIARANGSDTEICSDRSEQHLNPIHRSSSEGYLSQMEKHRQLNAKSNYKAEKIRRQKLYSNVIREQNKKISRIPSLSAKDSVGSDNKDTVPRRKALEYAKTIVKPKPPPKPKDIPREQNVSARTQYPQEMDPFHLATLEMLRRHEEEKRAVARFRTIHAV
ncbi:putative protein C11orf63-like protein [Labeo rohita]|uniref:Uncharacterized protein n=1 Tax=Labeo rohita TaxID=84645 RepID=A0A498LVQ1_LABRO|nr:putative protein C11orf63-like protein [Labeo rohita]